MKRLHHRSVLVISIFTGLCLLFFGITVRSSEATEEFPVKPIYLVVPYNPGGGTDVPARALSSTVTEFMNNQPLIVVNKPGSSGMIGPKYVVSQKPDGYTLLIAWGGPDYIAARHVRDLPIDVYADFKPIIGLVRYSSCIAVPKDSSFQTLKDLVAYAKDNPGKLNFTHTGKFGEHHLNALDLMRKAGIKMNEVPSDGGPQARNRVAGAHMDVGFFATFLAPPVLNKIRVLGVSYPQRDPLVPDVPTVNESGYDIINAYGFKAIVAPAATPDWKIQILYEAFKKAAEHKAYQSIISKLHFEMLNWDAQTTLEEVKKQDAKYEELLSSLGLKK
jgi:tripartite-type tricarboxylate transporter receptor subunit TctC